MNKIPIRRRMSMRRSEAGTWMLSIGWIAAAGLLVLMLAGCGSGKADETAAETGDERTARQYVEERGYGIDSAHGEIDSYTLNASKLSIDAESGPYPIIWGVQAVKPDAYLGKQIQTYQFTVTNHPLRHIYGTDTNVYVMLCEGRAIGGYSFPVSNSKGEMLYGSAYSLDGRTLEEVTGLSYPAWLDAWREKYARNKKGSTAVIYHWLSLYL